MFSSPPPQTHAGPHTHKYTPTLTHSALCFLCVFHTCLALNTHRCASKTPDAVAIQDKIGSGSGSGTGCESVIGAVSPTAPPSWSQLGATGYTIAFAGGDGGCEDPPFTRVTAFQLLCADDVALAELVHVIEDPKCVYTAQFKINCAVARNGGLAGRWSFAARTFFMVFVIVLMYLSLSWCSKSARWAKVRSGSSPTNTEKRHTHFSHQF